MKILLAVGLFLVSFHSLFSQAAGIFSMPDLESAIEKIRVGENVPGLLLSIATKDSILFSGGFGLADVAGNVRVDEKKLFRLGSITKNFTALAILKLCYEGKFSLNDPVRKIAPEIEYTNRWEQEFPVRVIHLLEHTAGFDDIYYKAMYNTGAADPKGLELLKQFYGSLHARWKPGERTAYSNADYVVLGYLIEKFSGTDYERYVADHILKPLGMDHSNFRLRADPPQDYAKAYDWDGIAFREIPFYTIYGQSEGALNSCASDMARFVRFYLNNWKLPEGSFLPDSMLAAMEKPHSSLAARSGLTTGYAIGNEMNSFRTAIPFYGHGSYIDGFTSSFCYNRSLGVGYVVSINGPGRIRKIEDEIVSFLLKRYGPADPVKYQELNTAAVRPYLGTYRLANPRHRLLGWFETLTNTCTVSVKDDTLTVRGFMGAERRMEQCGDLLFIETGNNSPGLVFSHDDRGKDVMIWKDRYYEKTAPLRLCMERLLLLLSVAGLLFSLLAGLAWIIRSLMRHSFQGPAGGPLLSALFAPLFLMWGLIPFALLAGDPQTGATVNAATGSVFVGTALFAVSVLTNDYVLFKHYKRIGSKPLKWLLLFCAVFTSYLALLLALNGWIGLRVWTL